MYIVFHESEYGGFDTVALSCIFDSLEAAKSSVEFIESDQWSPSERDDVPAGTLEACLWNISHFIAPIESVVKTIGDSYH